MIFTVLSSTAKPHARVPSGHSNESRSVRASMTVCYFFCCATVLWAYKAFRGVP